MSQKSKWKDFEKKGDQQNADLSNYVFGKVAPNSVPLERAALGAIMLDKDAISVVIDIIEADDLYDSRHPLIYKAFIRLFERSQPIDILTVTNELKASGDLENAGGGGYITTLTNRVTSAANLEYHARIIAQLSMRRKVIKTSVKSIEEAYDPTVDVFDLVDNAEQGIFDVASKHLVGSVEKSSDLALKALKQIEAAAQQGDGLTGVPSGFSDLDRVTSGWQKSDLIIIAARPGMGKTAIMLGMAKNASMDFGKDVAIFSLEMSKLQLTTRLISLEAEISGSKLRSGSLEPDEWKVLHHSVEKITNAKSSIHIDDTPGISVFELRAKCRRLKMQNPNLSMIIIDYLQLMTGGGSKNSGNREQEISFISRSLKGLAKDLNVPVIALSQLSRAVEQRGGTKRPQLSDLRESGAIEQDSDIVTFIYLPEYYQILEDEEGQSLKGIGEVIIAKHRNGALGTVKLKFTDRYAKFSDLDDFESLPDAFENIASSINTGLPENVIKMARNGNEEDIPF